MYKFPNDHTIQNCDEVALQHRKYYTNSLGTNQFIFTMNVIKALALPCSSNASQVISVVPPSGETAAGDRPVPQWVPPKKKPFNPAGGVVIDEVLQCPLANVAIAPSKIRVCPFHAHKQRGEFFHVRGGIPLDEVPGKKRCDDETVANEDTARLLKNIGGGDRIREICTRFYARAFIDAQLAEFFFNFDGATNHAQRLADWIIEHMGGEGACISSLPICFYWSRKLLQFLKMWFDRIDCTRCLASH